MVDAATDGACCGSVEVGGTVEEVRVELELKLTDERQRTQAACVQQRQQAQSSSPIAGTRDVIRRRIRNLIPGTASRTVVGFFLM